MFKIVVFVGLFAMTTASSSNITDLFDIFFKDITDNHQLADGSYDTTYFNIPHRQAPGLIEPFIMATSPTASQISVSNVMRLRTVAEDTRFQQVSDGEDYDYNVLTTAVSMDIKVSNLTGQLKDFILGRDRGQYLLNGNVRNLVMNVTMQNNFEEYRVIPERDVSPTNVDLRVTGDNQELATVQSLAAQIVGDLVTNLFYSAIRGTVNGKTAKALEEAVLKVLEN